MTVHRTLRAAAAALALALAAQAPARADEPPVPEQIVDAMNKLFGRHRDYQ